MLRLDCDPWATAARASNEVLRRLRRITPRVAYILVADEAALKHRKTDLKEFLRKGFLTVGMEHHECA
jgi:hypothetical protein